MVLCWVGVVLGWCWCWCWCCSRKVCIGMVCNVKKKSGMEIDWNLVCSGLVWSALVCSVKTNCSRASAPRLLSPLGHHSALLGGKSGDGGYRSPCLSHAKRALYHLSYIPIHSSVQGGGSGSGVGCSLLFSSLLRSISWVGYLTGGLFGLRCCLG